MQLINFSLTQKKTTVCYGGPRLGGCTAGVLQHGAQQPSLSSADGLLLLRLGRRRGGLRLSGFFFLDCRGSCDTVTQ